MSTDKNRSHTRIAVYLLPFEGDKIWLAKRQNTGHMDGNWSLVAGHVHEFESCRNAAIRELEEECGLLLPPQAFKLVGAMHHNSTPFDYVNYVYKIDLSGNKLSNLEPEKCEQLAAFSLDNLPRPMENYVEFIINKSTQRQIWIEEYGF